MKKYSLIILCLLISYSAFTQNEFYNNGGLIYLNPGALLHINGDLSNTSNSQFKNDGVIELTGNLLNDSLAEFTNGSTSSGAERVTKLIGTGTQVLSGKFNGTNNHFYNLVIDKPISGTLVELHTDVTVEGSLVWGSNTSGSATYTPSSASIATNYSGFGIVKTYDSGNDYELYVKNASLQSIKGYAQEGILEMSMAPFDKYILQRGSTNIGNGGLSRDVSIGSVTFPIYSANRGYNPITLHISNVGSNPKVRAKFSESSATIGTISQWSYDGQTPDNSGYNRKLSLSGGDLPSCLGSLPNDEQWIIFDCVPQNHGYWSFDGDASDVYWIESFPNLLSPGFNLQGNPDDNWRLIKESTTPFNSVPNVDWRTQIDSVSNLSDLGTYTRFGSGGCYTGEGVPGGMYTGFSHFQLSRVSNNNALPVEYLSLEAIPVDNSFIQVSWVTSIEINNKGFYVQRSLDGITFENIGWVDGNGNATSPVKYTFNDMNVLANQVYYYRLHQIDFDNVSKLSKIVSAEIQIGSVFSIGNFYPNPAQTSNNVVVNSSFESDLKLQIFNTLGQEVVSKNYQLSKGATLISLELNTLADGIYQCIFISGEHKISRPFVMAKN